MSAADKPANDTGGTKVRDYLEDVSVEKILADVLDLPDVDNITHRDVTDVLDHFQCEIGVIVDAVMSEGGGDANDIAMALLSLRGRMNAMSKLLMRGVSGGGAAVIAADTIEEALEYARGLNEHTRAIAVAAIDLEHEVCDKERELAIIREALTHLRSEIEMMSDIIEKHVPHDAKAERAAAKEH